MPIAIIRQAFRQLLVDDTPIIINRLSKALAAIDGVNIVGVWQDSAQAICDVARLSPNLIVLDNQLRDSNRWDVLQSVTHINPQTRVFIFSNDNSEATRERFTAGGADRFLDKSLELGAPHQTVRNLADASGSAAIV